MADRRATLFTPGLELGILAGVTRATLLESAAELGYVVREGAYPVDELAAAEEAFTSSSVREVMPVVELDGQSAGRRPPRPGGRRAPGRAPEGGDHVRIRILTCAERPDLWERSYNQITGVWPTYNEQGDVLTEHWSRLDEDFRDFQFVLYDEEHDLALAHGHSIPFFWDGTVAGLPAGIDAVHGGRDATLRRRRASRTRSPRSRSRSRPSHQGSGHSRTMIGGMRDIAARHGFENLVAPLRPTWKERYPLTPIDRYAAWTRGDGLPFDPWIRLHVRLGAEILQPVQRSLRITGTVGEWEEWTDTPFPGERHLRLPALPCDARRRPRGRSRLVLGAERLGAPPRRLSACGSSRSSIRPMPPRASSPLPSSSAGTS